MEVARKEKNLCLLFYHPLPSPAEKLNINLQKWRIRKVAQMKATKGILILTKKFHQKRVLHASKIDVQSLVNQKTLHSQTLKEFF